MKTIQRHAKQAYKFSETSSLCLPAETVRRSTALKNMSWINMRISPDLTPYVVISLKRFNLASVQARSTPARTAAVAAFHEPKAYVMEGCPSIIGN